MPSLSDRDPIKPAGAPRSQSEPPNVLETKALLAEIWPIITSDNTLTLHGFRRFRTLHLFNLRILEKEIDGFDRNLYQAALATVEVSRPYDKLGVGSARRDTVVPSPSDVANPESLKRLRELLTQYGRSVKRGLAASQLTNVYIDSALVSYNTLMRMETFSLADNIACGLSRLNRLNPYEIYKTRLVKADLPLTRPRPPLLKFFHTNLRRLWFYVCKKKVYDRHCQSIVTASNAPRDIEKTNAAMNDHHMAFQNTIDVSQLLFSFLVALVSGVLLIVPLCILSYQHGRGAHLITVAISILTFSFITACSIRTSGPETIAASAAYSAVLAVFLSNTPD